MKHPYYNENEFREDIIKKFLAVPVLGKNYIDYHTDEGECALEIHLGDDVFHIIINKER